MSKLVKKTITVAILAVVPLATVIGSVAADPTRGRIDARVNTPSKAYFQCAKFSLRVLQACTETANRKKPVNATMPTALSK